MKVWTQLEKYKREDSNRALILALGNFDGIHLGHQRILQSVVQHARKKNGIPAILTFYEHPQRVLHETQKPPLLTSPQHRLFSFQKMGIEICFLLHFTLAFSKTDPETFIREWLVKRLGVREVHLGYNAHFGFGRAGDCELMRKLSKPLGFDFYESDPVQVEGEFVSSSLIRQAIQGGDLGRAQRFLGRPFSLFASVVRGRGRGKSLGFPTANLRPHSEILPSQGVYPVELRQVQFHLKPVIEANEFDYELEELGEWRHGILNYGVRPTFESSHEEVIPEVFLFNFNGNLYGKTVEVLFHPKLRDEKHFSGADELVQAIEGDVSRAQEYFRTLHAALYKGG